MSKLKLFDHADLKTQLFVINQYIIFLFLKYLKLMLTYINILWFFTPSLVQKK